MLLNCSVDIVLYLCVCYILCIIGFIWCCVSVGHWDQYDTFVYPKRKVLNMTSVRAMHYPLSNPERYKLDIVNENCLLSYLLRHKRDIVNCEVTDVFYTVNAVEKIFTRLSQQIYCSLLIIKPILHDPIAAPQLREVSITDDYIFV